MVYFLEINQVKMNDLGFLGPIFYGHLPPSGLFFQSSDVPKPPQKSESPDKSATIVDILQIKMLGLWPEIPCFFFVYSQCLVDVAFFLLAAG